jgi:hypothetical protein
MKKIIMSLCIGMFPLLGFAHGDAAPAGVGPGKGVESYDEHEGFVLSKEAIRNFELKSRAVLNGLKCDLSGLEIVQVLNEKKVYRIRDSKISSVSINCKNFTGNDEGVIHGAPFLRVVEMDLQQSEGEEEEEGHHD